MSAETEQAYEQIVRRAATRLEALLSAQYGQTWSLVLVRADPLEWSAVWSLGSAGASSPDNIVQVHVRLSELESTTTTDAQASSAPHLDLTDLLVVRDDLLVDMLEQIAQSLSQPQSRERDLARSHVASALHWLQEHRRKAGAP